MSKLGIEAIKHHKISELKGPMLRGATLMRSLVCLSLKNITISGKVIDLGSNSNMPIEYTFLNDQSNSITLTDLYPRNPETIKLDLEEEFPFNNNEYDTSICFNVLPVIFNSQKMINSIYRITGTKCILTSAFVRQLAPHPQDYVRYTSQGLKLLFENAGFQNIKVIPVGHGPFSLAWSLIENYISNNYLRYYLLHLPWMLDNLLYKLNKNKKDAIMIRSEVASIVIALK